MTIADTDTLGDARDWLRERVNDGEHCPCCGQFAKVYRRKIHSRMAADLLTAYRDVGQSWWDSRETLRYAGGDYAKLAYWHLIQESTGDYREDGSTRTGLWRLTDHGVAFAEAKILLPKYARIYDGRCLGFDGELIGIQDALGTKFHYADLMAGV